MTDESRRMSTPSETASAPAVVLTPREWMFASLAIALQSALFLAPALFGTRVLLPADLLASYAPWSTGLQVVPQNANLSDSLQQFYPYLHFFRDQVWKGHFPLWNPYVLCGAPFLANMVSATLFPVTWLVLLLSPETFFEWSAFLKLFVAGLGIYLFSRESLHVHPLTAWSAAAAYSFCGYTVYFLGFPNTYVTMLLPWSLLVLDRGFLRGNIRFRWVFSILVAALLVSGHVESAALAILFFLLYITVLVFDSGAARMQGPAISIRRTFLPLLFHVAWGVLMASAALLPFVSYLRESVTFLSRTQAVNPFHISLLRLPAMWVPYFFGSPIFSPRHATLGQMEQCIFLGGIPLLLAFNGMSRSLNRRVPAIIAGLLVSFLITFGVWPFFQLFTSLPLLKQGNHMHAIQIFQFCAVLLFALGLERWSISARQLRMLPALFLVVQLGLLIWQWFSSERPFPFLRFQSAVPWYGIITLLLLFLLCVTQLKPGWARPLAAVSIPALGFLYGFYFNPAVPSRLLRDQTLFNEMNREMRIAGVGDGTLLPNMSMTVSLRELRGYESVVLLRTQRFFDQVTGRSNDPQHSIHKVDQSAAEVLKQCGVGYLISPTPLLIPGWIETRKPGAFLYRAAEPVPRALFVGAATRATAEESLKALLDGRTGDTLYLESGSVGKRAPASGAVEMLAEGPDRRRYKVGASAPGYLLVRETYEAGWSARVNEKSADVVRANYLFMAVAVSGGNSIVDLNYRPWSWIEGLALTLFSLPIAVGGIFWGGWGPLLQKFTPNLAK